MRLSASNIILLFALSILGYFYITDKAIQTRVETRTIRVIETKIDTVSVTKIEYKWKTKVEYIKDTIQVIKPDTIFVSTESTGGNIDQWKEWIVRLLSVPPKVEFTTVTPTDSSYRHYVYDYVPWGYLIEPSDDGTLRLQLIDRPDLSRKLIYDYKLGAGYELRYGPAVYGLATLKYRGWTLDAIATVHAYGLRGSFIISK